MKHYSCSCLSVALVAAAACLWSSAGAAAGDVAAGEKKAYFCSTCHGADGNATITGTPRLAGMSVRQFTEKMKAYKSGKVVYHPMMAILTNGLSDQDIADLAAFYASRKPEDSLKPYSSPLLK
ncbi:MAG TPA: c-type cytochrome [Thiobacillaceae bacterium]|nr:c-type cytochrome [Thiobacillaceae bacterium]